MYRTSVPSICGLRELETDIADSVQLREQNLLDNITLKLLAFLQMADICAR